MDKVGAAIAFSNPLVAIADISHTPLAVPVPNHGDEYITALLTPEQPCIAVLRTVPVGWTGLLFLFLPLRQQYLSLLPNFSGYDGGEEVLMLKLLLGLGEYDGVKQM